MVSRRGTPELLVAALLGLLLIWYVWYTNGVVRDLEREGRKQSSVIFSRALSGQSDPGPGAGSRPRGRDHGDHGRRGADRHHLARGRGIRQGEPAVRSRRHDRRIRRPAGAGVPSTLDRDNPPFVDASGATVHFGQTRLVQGLRVIPALQALTGLVLLFAFIYIVRTRTSAARERLWTGMARESAHQIGTPLSSLTGWIELLEERSTEDPSLGAAVRHMRGDLERLDRVAHRFERIGRDPKFELMDVRDSVERIATYFRARVPTLANTVRIDVTTADVVPRVQGDLVLLEWALEVLVKNAIDALAGRGGTVAISVEATPDEGVAIRVADDGPGVPREIRGRVFDPGFSTKKSGWGIGLSLAKRIVEENHGGKLALLPTDRGATFEIILQ